MGIFVAEKKSLAHGAVDTIIGERATIRGEIVSAGSVSINGKFEGKLMVEGEVIVAHAGKIVGDIKGGVVIVSGRVDGNIYATERVEIIKSGQVHGDLNGGKIVIEEGATYSGKVTVEGVGASVEQLTTESIPT